MVQPHMMAVRDPHIDWAEAQNSQTGGAVAGLYGSGGGLLQTVPADNAVYAVNWSPVYSIRNC